MNNYQTRSNVPFEGDEGEGDEGEGDEGNVLPDADIPLVYESGDEDDEKYIFTNQMMKVKKLIER